MINSGREWDWMDDKQQQHDLEGWGFDMERLKTTERGGGGASLSPPKVPRAFSTKVSNDIPGFEGTLQQLDELSLYDRSNICNYSGLRSTEDYI